MRPEALLQSACELSYDIAREGLESDPPVDAPQPMRGFLRSGRLTERALTVARSAIDEDPGFRRRVAEQADESVVGRAGYLWLHRPIGWAAEFEELVSDHAAENGIDGDHDADSTDAEGTKAEGTDADSTAADQSADESEDDDDASEDDEAANADERGGDEADSEEPESVPAVHLQSEGEPVYPTNDDDDKEPDSANEANAIESELSSLRGLVDRLASERKAVATSAERVEQQVQGSRQQPSVFESDVYTLQSELETARTELERANRERDSAIQQHSAALTRQLDLEKELDKARERQAEIERGHEEADSELVTVKELLAVSEAAVEPLRAEANELNEQLEAVKAANAELTEQVETITAERNDDARAAELRIHELESDLADLGRDRDALKGSLAESHASVEDMTAKLNAAVTQSAESSALVDMLTEEKIDVASRLADTESMLETTRTQLNNVRADAEALAADLSNVKAHRDGLSTQVEELHASLSEALDSLARVRATSDADRASLKEVRTERDQLKVRVSSLEQVEATVEAKLQAVSSERDLLMTQAEEANAERSEIERKMREVEDAKVLLEADQARHDQAMAEVTSARDELSSEVKIIRADLAEAQSVRDGLAQQVEQLTAENAAIQDQLVESDRLRVETSESQGHALSELAQRLSVVEKERARLEAELTEAREGVPFAALGSGAIDGSSGDGPAAVEGAPMAPAIGAGDTSGLAVGIPAADGDDDGADADEFGAAPAAAVADLLPSEDAEPEQDQSRTTNRHTWSLGPLLRGGGRGRKAAATSEDSPALLPPPPGSTGPSPEVDDEEFDSIAAAVAEATKAIGGGAAVDADAVKRAEDAEFEAVSSGLAEALGPQQPPPPLVDDEDELDAISNLISQTVSDMKLNDNGSGNGIGEQDDDAEGRGADGKPPSIFSEDDNADISPNVFDDDTSSLPRSSASAATAPPSVLNSVSGGAATARRQIAVPDELLGDELEVARHIVSSPDVVLLVDGDSVARMGWPSLPVVQQRDALVSYLADLSASTGVAPDIVFDGRKGEEESLPESRAVRIRLSTPPTEPAAALDELVDAYPEQWPIAIVTDDEDLAGSAGERGASVLSNGQLLDLFIAP